MEQEYNQEAYQDLDEIFELIPKELPIETQEALKVQLRKTNNQVVKYEELQEHVQKLYSQNIVELHFGLQKFRAFLGSDSAAAPDEQDIQQVLDFNIASKLFDIIRDKQSSPIILYEAVQIVANLANGTYDQIQIILQNDGIDLLLRLLNHEKQKVWEQAVWGIGNIAADCIEFRNVLLNKGAFDLIVKAIKECLLKKSKFLQDCAWSLCNLCIGQPAPQFYYVKNGISVFCPLLTTLQDEESLENVCWALANISDSAEAIKEIIKSGVVSRLIELLLHQAVAINFPAIRVIGNILSGDEKDAGSILKYPIKFGDLMKNKKNAFIREVCWCLSNITAGSQQQVNKIIKDKQLIRKLIELVETSTEDIKKEIAWIFANASTNGNSQDLANFVDKDIIIAFSKLLDLQNPQSLNAFLEGIFQLLQKGKELSLINNEKNQFVELFLKNEEIVRKIENLQTHQDQQIYAKVSDILEQFFESK